MLGNLFDETIQEWYSPLKKAVFKLCQAEQLLILKILRGFLSRL